jgi:hypothetical protein
MDWIIWLVVIAVIVAVVWWLLNRNSSRGRSGSAGSQTGTGTAAKDDSTPPHLHDANHDPSHRGALSGGGSSPSAAAAGLAWMPTSAGFNQAEPGAEPEPAPDPAVEAEDRAVAEAHAKARAAAAAAAAAAEVSGTETPGTEAAGTPAPGTEAAGAGAAAAPAADAAPAETAPAESPEWETQWSETPPAEPHAAVHPEPGHPGTVHGAGAHAAGEGAAGAAVAGAAAAGGAAAPAGGPVHHPEYTEPHAPTLPGAESAAAEADLDVEPASTTETGVKAGAGAHVTEHSTAGQTAPPQQTATESPLAEAEARQTALSAAASETAASHEAEPAGHLAADQPYGEGSAAPAPDGSGPEGFTVKGNASSMTYHEETSLAYEETRAEVWFLSAAHAEAAGFRPPRRTRQ